jgi:hypothetical protein
MKSSANLPKKRINLDCRPPAGTPPDTECWLQSADSAMLMIAKWDRWEGRRGIWYCFGVANGLAPSQMYKNGWRFHSIVEWPHE